MLYETVELYYYFVLSCNEALLSVLYYSLLNIYSIIISYFISLVCILVHNPVKDYEVDMRGIL